jgi:hypothetical protein
MVYFPVETRCTIETCRTRVLFSFFVTHNDQYKHNGSMSIVIVFLNRFAAIAATPCTLVRRSVAPCRVALGVPMAAAIFRDNSYHVALLCLSPRPIAETNATREGDVGEKIQGYHTEKKIEFHCFHETSGIARKKCAKNMRRKAPHASEIIPVPLIAVIYCYSYFWCIIYRVRHLGVPRAYTQK